MQVKILNKTKNEIKIEITGEGHTFCNIIQKTLLKNPKVDLAGYNVLHPLTSNPVIYVRTKEGRPETVLKEIIGDLQIYTKAFRESLDKALNEWQS